MVLSCCLVIRMANSGLTKAIPPQGIALLICDNIFVDSSGKLAIVGVVSRIVVREFPATVDKLCVYASITEIYPKAQCEVEILGAESGSPIFHAKGPVDGDSVTPMTVCDLVFELRGITFQSPGKYYARLSSGGSTLIERPFEIAEVKAESKPEDAEGDQHE